MQHISKQSSEILRRSGLAVYCFCMFGLAEAQAQILLDAPVYDFRMPMFGDNGYVIWDLKGSQCSYWGGERIEVKNLTLRLFSGDSTRSVTVAVSSPDASIFPDQRRAASGSSLHVVGGNFEIVGKKWDWMGDDQTLWIRENVRMTISERITDILR